MRYKIPEPYRTIPYVEYPSGLEEVVPMDVRVVSVRPIEFDPQDAKKVFPHGRKGFDISTTTKNYFAKGVLVHNSLIIVYHYAGEWHANTSGSFGLGQCQFSGMTWRELFWKTSNVSKKRLLPEYTYVFELCTPYNKVVRTYPKATVFLLSAFEHCGGDEFVELSVESADIVAWHLNVKRPTHYHFKSEDEIRAFLMGVSKGDKTFEGVIIRDDKNERYKIKSETYVALHHLKDNGNICNPKRIVPLILAGEIDEVIAYLPEVEEHLRACEEKVSEAWTTLLDIWRQYWQIENQKEFAQQVIGKTSFTSILFSLRKRWGKDQNESLLSEEWRMSAKLIIKRLYG